MLKTPIFSVIIPLFNKESYIESTLNSVINQTFKDFEIIIVNDGSTDKSLREVKKINDPRIKIYSNKNNGLAYSRNYGIKKASSNYLALLDADDLWVNNYLECISRMITIYGNEYVFATNNYIWFDQAKPNLEVISKRECKPQLIHDYFSIGKNIFSYSSIVFHKSIFENIGYFNENVNHGEEEEFSIRCFLKYNLVYLKDQKVFYLKNVKNQLTEPNKNRERILPEYEIYLKNNINKSLRKYIDFIHFKLLILYKMEKNHMLVMFYKRKIKVSNLTPFQKIKYYLPTNLFFITKHIYMWFSNKVTHS